MDRLTVTGCKFLTPAIASKNELLDEIRRHQKYYDRLAAYEDTGLTPEEIVNLNTFSGSQLEKLLAENATLKKALKVAMESVKNGLCYEDVMAVVEVVKKHCDRQEVRDSNEQ